MAGGLEQLAAVIAGKVQPEQSGAVKLPRALLASARVASEAGPGGESALPIASATVESSVVPSGVVPSGAVPSIAPSAPDVDESGTPLAASDA
jgi:hypothetical protein